MKKIWLSRWTRLLLFALCLLPLFHLVWRGYREDLTANPIEFITHETGNWTLRFLLITLAITPLREILKQPQLIRFRRMLGLFAFFYGLLHLTTWIWLDKAFDVNEMWEDVIKRRFITMGMAGLLLMIPLALTSTGWWVRRLGYRRWQLLHRLIYFSALAGVIHYYWLVKSDIRLPLLYGAILAVLMLYRLAAIEWTAMKHWFKFLPAILVLCSAPAFCQDAATDPAGGGTALAAINNQKVRASTPTPRASDGKPDLTGIWSPDRTFIYDISTSLKPGEELPLQPWALKVTKEHMSKEDPEANCLPAGVPRMAPYPWKIIQTPGIIIFLFEGNIHTYRQIFLDGRGHPKDPEPTWYGDSIGKWEGDTLVVDSVGFNDKFWFDFAGHPHTEKLHVVERYRRPDTGHLDYDVTIEDPGAYTKPFTMHGHSEITNSELMEYICNENNQDVSHIVGKDTRK